MNVPCLLDCVSTHVPSRGCHPPHPHPMPPRVSLSALSLFSPPFTVSRTAATPPLPRYEATASRLLPFTRVLARDSERFFFFLWCVLQQILTTLKKSIVPFLSTIGCMKGLHFLPGLVLIIHYISPYRSQRDRQALLSTCEHDMQAAVSARDILTTRNWRFLNKVWHYERTNPIEWKLYIQRCKFKYVSATNMWLNVPWQVTINKLLGRILVGRKDPLFLTELLEFI